MKGRSLPPWARRAAFALLVLSGCGASTPGAERDEPEAHTARGGERPVEVEATLAEAAPTPDLEPTPEPPIVAATCEALDVAGCGAREDCVWDGGCRAPRDACESLRSVAGGWPAPAFDRGDPCELARPGCAWSASARRCVPFQAVVACPATLPAAEALTVLCNHSGQAPLACRYGQTRCECRAPGYCGGAPPPPWIQYPASTFSCVPPVDARGCPTDQVREGARCAIDPQVSCESCSSVAQCVGGRWRVRMLPPRP